MKDVEHLFIVGAGFSYGAGLPLTDDFTEKLLDIGDYKTNGPSGLAVKFLQEFVSDTFDHEPTVAAKYWPHLEDIFTSVDLSANTGHHLGEKYSPSDLRTVRRALIVRTIRMLRQQYTRVRRSIQPGRVQLKRFFSRIDPERSAFLSMNWDTVIEEEIRRAKKVSSFDYGCDAEEAVFRRGKIELAPRRTGKTLQVLKPHGSVNWLYCDACRQLFWFDPATSTSRIANHLFKESDWKVVERVVGVKSDQSASNYVCPRCHSAALGTRFATFSYRKALDFRMHVRSWLTAEHLLRETKTWIFIGYSLPAADYEFKHLLKRVQLSRPNRPKIVLITGGDGANETRRNYQKFFGPSIRQDNRTFFGQGLDEKAMTRLAAIGALAATK